MKKSKILAVALAVVLILSATFLVINAMTKETKEPSEGLTYHLSDDKTFYIVSDYNHNLSDPDLVIPEEYNGLPVKEIAVDAFNSRTWLRSVYIPKSIVKIGHGAFGSTGLKEVYFNAELCQDFDSRNWVFYPDENGKMEIKVTIGKDVKKVPTRLFYPLDTLPRLNPNVISIEFEEGCKVEEIGDYAFYNISNVDTIEFPTSLKKIGKYAFYGNELTNISFNDGLEEISDHAFDTSKKITSITLPNSIKRVGKSAFRNALLLEEVNSSAEDYTVLEVDTFKYCVNLNKVNLPNIIELKESAFEGCSSLTSFDMPNIKIIGPSSFKDCTGVKKIILDTNLESIGNNAFDGCTNVLEIVLRSNKINDLAPANSAFYNCGSNTSGITVMIEGEVETIAKRLFLSSSNNDNLPKITQIIINAPSLKLIDDYAFGYIDAKVTYVGTKTMWANVDVHIGNNCFTKVNCVKELAGE